jgi:hypothetical protein
VAVTIVAILVAAHLAAPPSVAVRPLSLKTICSTVWGKDARHVDDAMKRQVAKTAGIPWSQHARYEFDHRIPRSLGGADVVENLQMQPWPIARRKDRDEVRFGRLVCAGQMDLDVARRELWNWRAQ